MMLDNIDISDLYRDYIISGETYLYCVEKNISTLQDILSMPIDNIAEPILSNIIWIRKEFYESNDDNIQTNTVQSNQTVEIIDNCHDIEESNNIVTVEYITFYSDKLRKEYKKAHKAVKQCIEDMLSNYGNFDKVTSILLQVKTKEDLSKYINPKYNCDNNTINPVLDIAYEIQSLGLKYSLYDELYSACSKLKISFTIKREEYFHFGNKLEYINWVLNCNFEDLSVVYTNLNNKTISSIWNIFERIKYLSTINELIIPHKYKIKNYRATVQSIDENQLHIYISLLESKKYLLSSRANTVLSKFLEKNTYKDLFNTALSHNYKSFQGCGSKTEEELIEFFDNIFFMSTSLSSKDISYQLDFEKYKKAISLPDNVISDIINKEDEVKHFPLFYTIQQYISYLNERDLVILEGLIDIYNNQILQSRDIVAEKVNLTQERVRQLRPKVLQDLHNFILSLEDISNIKFYSYDKLNDINLDEGTNFQDNFIYWVITLLNNEWTYIGNIEEVFYNPHGHQVNLNIVPTYLNKEFNFEKFITDFKTEFKKRRNSNIEINLQSFCLNYFKHSIQIAILNDIVYECKKIVIRLFDCISYGDIIILQKNAHKGISEIAEEILREYGAPMTSEQMYAVLQEKYPDQQYKGAASLNAGALRNQNIRPIGRTSTFTLKEWNIDNKRGGTIREFAEEYILKQEDKIAKLEDIGEYVRKYRTRTTDANIQTNLMAETSGKFALFIKNNDRYIGLSGIKYDESYIPGEESIVTVRSFDTSKRLVEEFILKNKRYPYSSGSDIDESEKRLGRFWERLVFRVKKGDINENEKQFYEYINNTYSHLYMPKNEYKWREAFNKAYNILKETNYQDLDDNSHSWIKKNIQLLSRGELDDWQKQLIEQLLLYYYA